MISTMRKNEFQELDRRILLFRTRLADAEEEHSLRSRARLCQIGFKVERNKEKQSFPLLSPAGCRREEAL